MKLLLVIALYGCIDAPSSLKIWDCKGSTDMVYEGCKKQLYALRRNPNFKKPVERIEKRCMEYALRSTCDLSTNLDIMSYQSPIECGNHLVTFFREQ